jgi:choline dehydrogenase-like flavoprotein
MYSKCWVPFHFSVVHAHNFVLSNTDCKALKSLQVLELSGIGWSKVLSQIGVETKVELLGVGKNFQDHSIIFELHAEAPVET